MCNIHQRAELVTVWQRICNKQETEDSNISKHQQTRQLRRVVLDHWITIVIHSSGFQDHTMGAIPHLHTHHRPVLRKLAKQILL